MRNIVTIAIKDLRLLWRDKFGMFWVIVFPVMMATFFGSLMSGMNQQSPVKIAVVDEDDSEISRAFLKQLGESTAVAIVKPPRADQQAANGEAAPVQEKVDVDLTRGQVQAGDVAAYVLVKKGFGENGFMPVASAIEIGIDPSRRVEAGLLQGVIMEAVFAPMKDLFSKPERMKEQIAKARESMEKADDLRADQRLMFKALFAAVDQISDTMANEAIAQESPFAAGKPEIVEVTARRVGKPTSGYEISFPQSITWGIFGCVSAFAMSLVQERTLGTYLRLRVAPVGKAEILAGKGLACFVSCCLVSIFLLVFGRLVFGIRVLDPIKLSAAIVASSLCFVGFMMFASVLGRTERAVAGSVWALIMPMAMLGGSMVPLLVMPRWMQTAGSVSPVKWTILAFEGAIWRGLPWIEMASACGVLLVMGAVMYAAGVFILLKYDT